MYIASPHSANAAPRAIASRTPGTATVVIEHRVGLEKVLKLRNEKDGGREKAAVFCGDLGRRSWRKGAEGGGVDLHYTRELVQTRQTVQCKFNVKKAWRPTFSVDKNTLPKQIQSDFPLPLTGTRLRPFIPVLASRPARGKKCPEEDLIIYETCRVLAALANSSCSLKQTSFTALPLTREVNLRCESVVLQRAGVCVCVAVTDPRDNKRVALKKMSNVFQNVVSAIRVYRELRMLCHFRHENVLSAQDILQPGPMDFLHEMYP
ncbi:hypothetical protein RRG08_045491 [Elysia crispata]|uniref:Protein kinase domain-containing protein n=1 Tax=Elysia crispata TaxID=231223 RepID=A0AAE1DXN0_9GAST|nr:hypothetical protein RRG08_045491 [Elysia crispata]